jgi:predicted MPP superfamily phosphohydrolase
MKRLRSHLGKTVYGVWGNHDTIRMVPGLEDMGIRILLNECELVSRGGEKIYLTGIDEVHFYQVDNIEKAASNIPPDAFSILLSHTSEVYRQAAHAGFDVLLSGHSRRSNLSAGFYPDHLVLGATETVRIGGLEVPRHGRIYLRRCRILHLVSLTRG